jgi:hypothetical protein
MEAEGWDPWRLAEITSTTENKIRKKRVAVEEICTIDGEESTGRPLSLQV